ncbi:MAG: hypothetical protein IH991_15260 [Planctomycetes bacterium]|nr:hypothetical protein [Planctomycetota bacterium]
METLRSFMTQFEPGPIDDTSPLEPMLASTCDQFTGDDEGMTGAKIWHRMENARWEPPIIEFSIERHGGTVLGSTRAEIQHWRVNVETVEATCWKKGHRQLRPMAERIYIRPLVEEIVQAILNGQDDDRIDRQDDGSVLVKTCDFFPPHSAVKMTLEGRRQRFRKVLAEQLALLSLDGSVVRRERNLPAGS